MPGPPINRQEDEMESDERPGSVLDEQQSWDVLQRCGHGRLAVAVRGKPDIYPINYIAHEGALLMRTNPGTKLAELTVNPSVAFEVDEVVDGKAWSVVVTGNARVVESQSEMDRLDRLPLKPWIPTLKYTYVEITPDHINGRYFELGDEPERY